MEHPSTRALYEYWNALRNGRAAPFRSEVDPRKMGVSLENMFIMESLPGGQLRFRVAGTGLCKLFGMELRGMVSDSIVTPESAAKLRALAKQVLEAPAVGVMRAEAVSGRSVWPGMELLLLPLRNELGEMSRLLGCVNAAANAPRRGDFDQLRLSCQSVTLTTPEITEEETQRADPVMGLAEPAAPFAREPAGPPQLTAIEGARPGGAPGPKPKAGRRPHLRVVKD